MDVAEDVVTSHSETMMKLLLLLGLLAATTLAVPMAKVASIEAESAAALIKEVAEKNQPVPVAVEEAAPVAAEKAPVAEENPVPVAVQEPPVAADPVAVDKTDPEPVVAKDAQAQVSALPSLSLLSYDSCTGRLCRGKIDRLAVLNALDVLHYVAPNLTSSLLTLVSSSSSQAKWCS
jgi:hypothetical protein